MHYANGQEAKAGDLVRTLPEKNNGVTSIGILVSAQAGSLSCNGQALMLMRKTKSDAGEGPWVQNTSGYTDCVTVGDLLPVDVSSPPASPPPSPPSAS